VIGPEYLSGQKRSPAEVFNYWIIDISGWKIKGSNHKVGSSQGGTASKKDNGIKKGQCLKGKM